MKKTIGVKLCDSENIKVEASQFAKEGQFIDRFNVEERNGVFRVKLHVVKGGLQQISIHSIKADKKIVTSEDAVVQAIADEAKPKAKKKEAPAKKEEKEEKKEEKPDEEKKEEKKETTDKKK